MKVRQRNWLIAIAFLVVLGLIWNARRSPEHEAHHEEPPEVRAVLETAVLEPTAIQMTSDGTIMPRQQATLSPKIMSTVAAVMVREGDRVSAGQVLARLEAKDLEAGVAQAGASLSAAASSAASAQSAARLEEEGARADIQTATAAVQEATAHLSMVKTGARKQERAQARLAVDQAEAQYELARTEAGRMRSLFKQDVVTRQRLDQAETAERVALAALESARQQADMVAEGSRTEEVKAAEERLAQAQARLDAAKSRRLSAQMRREQAAAAAQQTSQARAGLQGAQAIAGYALIRAPFAGVVTRRWVDPGDQVGPGSPVIDVEDRSEWRIEADVPESEAGLLKLGTEVLTELDSHASAQRSARIVEIRPSADPASRTVRVKATLEDTTRLRSGMFARMIVAKGRQTSVSVPSEAVLDSEGLARVWVVSPEGRAELRVVTLGKTHGRTATVLSGLNAGERVAVTNTAALVEGARVLGAN